MTVKNIVELELSNTNSIYLLREGIFYRAYNRSAMRMVIHIHPYKVHSKWVKNVAETIYYCGFPQQSIEKVKQKALSNGHSINDEDEKNYVISGITANDNYENWQNQQTAYSIEQVSNVVKEEQVKYVSVKGIEIIDKIRAYSLENSTPMQTMLFVQQLKQMI